jgi:hypothetical protein
MEGVDREEVGVGRARRVTRKENEHKRDINALFDGGNDLVDWESIWAGRGRVESSSDGSNGLPESLAGIECVFSFSFLPSRPEQTLWL